MYLLFSILFIDKKTDCTYCRELCKKKEKKERCALCDKYAGLFLAPGLGNLL